MNNPSRLQEKLAILREVSGNRSQEYRIATWLKSPFNSHIWRGDFDDGRHIIIDFQVELNDGTSLTDLQHASLLDTFKCWLCVQTHFDATGGKILVPLVAYYKVIRVLQLIDYFLLNASSFELAKYGLQAITEGDIKCLVADLASYRETANSIYRWNHKLAQFLKMQSADMTQEDFAACKINQPLVTTIDTDAVDITLDMTEEEIVYARAYLWNKGFYNYAGSQQDYQYSPDTKKLALLIYRNTLWGKTDKPIPKELCLGLFERYRREYPAVPVRTGMGECLSQRRLALYRGNLRSLGLLAELGLTVPIAAMNTLSQNTIFEALKTKSDGRFRTLPQKVVFSAVRNAIEFVLEYGDDLVDSYLSIVKAAHQRGMDCHAYTMQYDIVGTLTPKIREMGVRVWHLVQYMTVIKVNPAHANLLRPPRSEYFRCFRANEGLYELLRVLYGALQICLGILMARRNGELKDLIARNCLDRSKRYLVFNNRKTGVAGKRQREARPIPEVAVKMIGILERLQAGLIEQGLLSEQTKLFARPGRLGLHLASYSEPSQYHAMDSFCDYFETPLNTDGHRYYIRPHQLRRFFVMLFFWGRSFGGMETLRWFLGQTEIEHLYHYITESTPGIVLRSVKAAYALEQVQDHAEGSEVLSDLLEKRYGTRQFSILGSEELEEYIAYLMDEGKVEIEPEFFETADGQNYKVLIKVKGGT